MLFDQAMRELPIPSQLTGLAMELVYAISPCLVVRNHFSLFGPISGIVRTDELSDLIPCQQSVLIIWSSNNPSVLFTAIFEKLRTLGRPLVAWHIYEPERQRLFVWHPRQT